MIKCNSNWNFNLDEYEDIPDVEIWVDCFDGTKNSNAKHKILIQNEPNVISGLNEAIIAYQNMFTHIFAYEEQILNNVKHSSLHEPAAKWVDFENYNFNKPKIFGVSTVVGTKNSTYNHQLRHELWRRQDEIKIPKNFYRSKHGCIEGFENNPVLGEEKEPLFDTMFHICIENITCKNHFTEKTLDPILCKSIPIVLGCLNIEQFFNTDTIYKANTIDEIIEICNSLTEKDYLLKTESINENFNKAIYWQNWKSRIYEKIKKLTQK